MAESADDRGHYAIRGGIEGRNRLRVVARVMHAGTYAFLDRLEIAEGQVCVDVGCGGGDVTRELARRVGASGLVIGIDIDPTKIELATAESRELGIGNVEFRLSDIRKEKESLGADLIYARFLLTHLPEPEQTLHSFHSHLQPGGRLAVEDIDFSAHLVHPDAKASRRYQQLYRDVVRRKGGDADIGPRLPMLLKNAGFGDIEVDVIQPMGLEGDVKLLNPLTMEAIADSVIEEGLASREEIDRVIEELYSIAADTETLAGVPRVFQVSGRRPFRPLPSAE
ncbi:MAG: methyltransferase domain-containing protein [Acidobacteriota bacterium]